MWILMVEALVALSLLVFIVWWTMYAGRPRQDKNVIAQENRFDPDSTPAAGNQRQQPGGHGQADGGHVGSHDGAGADGGSSD